MAYDSQYTKDECTAGPHAPLPDNNATAISLCRRLLRDAQDCGVNVIWVKVRGHSQAVPGERETRDQQHLTDAAFATVLGNDWADEAATRGKAGKRQREQKVAEYVHAHVDRGARASVRLPDQRNATMTTRKTTTEPTKTTALAPDDAATTTLEPNEAAARALKPEDAATTHTVEDTNEPQTHSNDDRRCSEVRQRRPASRTPAAANTEDESPQLPPSADSPAPRTAVTKTTRPSRTIDYTVTEASLDVARRNLYKELQDFCELGVISVGADGVISAAAPPAEIAQYDDGKLQTLIDSQVSIDDIF
eukprot:SAG31_NODE_4012_length_3665_cov_74.538138_2_plen_306_part_00